MVLPNGFFAPLPLPMMIPFMGIQSAVMAEQFGTMFQYGKRRISAMSNEEFNALTPEILQQRMTKQIEDMIPEMEKQIKAMRPMVELIIREFAEYIKLAGSQVGGAVQSEVEDRLEHFLHGLVFGHTEPQYEQTTTAAPPPQKYKIDVRDKPTIRSSKKQVGGSTQRASWLKSSINSVSKRLPKLAREVAAIKKHFTAQKKEHLISKNIASRMLQIRNETLLLGKWRTEYYNITGRWI